MRASSASTPAADGADAASLRTAMRPAETFKGLRWVNWAHTVSCTPAYYYEPDTVDDVRIILAVAASHREKVSC
jgi:hypothetical protein